ncbi:MULTISPECIES: hypothetical protein [Enterobacteriaceae]|uniref:hypothetical protein n=1 Tax=Enterobacteriaceae TaxID=543 RepID=UPI000502A03B|nr:MULTISPECIES: hypothetical protein [Citrobacter]EDV1004131.1 hypothetical protein [Salmonella enterica subsp. enterica]EJL1487329.1 hypothetical protein [Salmonella enterica]TKU78324.1 hypothetical protein FDW92_04395 [Citrobacter sp. wls706]UCA24352.1 hypothetical protein LA356_18780 [Citrobacter werkmanii]GAL46728.1 hypothetical protein CIWKM_16_00090 [Citrobacter werkmanii NBRC 105721]
MEISRNKVWEAKEWEGHVNDLLRLKVGEENYIPIPDYHNGDAGIEGYCTQGFAFQSYCPDEACTVDKLYEKQRDKMTADIGKFILDKKGYLKNILHNTKIRRWILVVPRHQSKHLNVHATKKESEVLTANLPYVDNEDFKILIWDRDNFKKEENELISSGLRLLKLDLPVVEMSDIDDLKDNSSEFVDNISRKLRKIRDDDKQVQVASTMLLKNIVMYKNAMTDLKDNYPTLHEKITNGILDREQDLSLAFFDNETLTPNQQIEILNNKLKESSRLHQDNLKCISTGVVGDWIMRCNLDF